MQLRLKYLIPADIGLRQRPERISFGDFLFFANCLTFSAAVWYSIDSNDDILLNVRADAFQVFGTRYFFLCSFSFRYFCFAFSPYSLALAKSFFVMAPLRGLLILSLRRDGSLPSHIRLFPVTKGLISNL